LLALKDRQSRLKIPAIVQQSFPARIIGNRSAVVLYAGFRHCEAVIHFTVASSDGEVFQELDVLSDSRFAGGSSFDDYQYLEFRLPRPLDKNQEMLVSVDVHVVSCEPSDDDADTDNPDPLVLLTSPRVVQRLGRRDRPAAHSLLLPSQPASPDDVQDIWLKAELPHERVHAALHLQISEHPGAPVAIDHVVPRQKLTVLKDYGHVIQCRSSPGAHYLMRVNGLPAKRVSFQGKRDQWISIPSQFLTGDYVLVDFQDLSGSVSSCQLWIKTPRVLMPKSLLQEISQPPFPDHLSAAQSYRFKSVQHHLRSGQSAVLNNQSLAALLEILERGPIPRSTYPAIQLPTSSDPQVSVVVPCHNNFHYTYCCLASLALAWNRTSYEVILVDDGSHDQTTDAESVFLGVRVLRNDSPLRFLQACNRGASLAKGRFIVLLNNDTEVTCGWLDALVDAFHRFRNVGLCGAKLLYPNGTLQEAGGIVWGSGNPWNYGREQSPYEPRFSYARQADYLSGAALMISSEAWAAVGGLSSYLEPMYFEDTDLCFKVRDAGFSTWYIPSAVVFHDEGATSGTDTSSGFKSYQEINRPKFKRKWASVYRSFGAEGQDPDLIKDRTCGFRVLFIDYKVSTPDQDAGSVAAINEIKLLQSCGAKVTFLPANLGHLGSHVEALNRDGVEVITAPFYLSLESFLLERGEEFDLFYVNRYDVAHQVLPMIRRVGTDAKVILNLADLHYLRLLRSASTPGSTVTLEEALDVKIREIEIMKQVDLVLSYSLQELAAIEASTDCKAVVAQAPWFVDIPADVLPRRQRSGISFVGNYLHHPNVEGVNWFCDQVVPLLKSSNDPRLNLHLYGSRMPDSIKQRASASITIQGYVEELSTVYNQHMIFVAPLLSGAGIKGKVMNALASGIPCVLSPYAAEGIDLRDGYDCMIARTPDQWAEAIHRLLDDEALWARISMNSREFVKTCFAFDKALSKMVEILERVDVFADEQHCRHFSAG